MRYHLGPILIWIIITRRMLLANNPQCPYCNQLSKKVSGKEIYPHRSDLKSLIFYQCVPCDAYVGTHKGTSKPLGRLASKELREARAKAYAVFERIWIERHLTRSSAYKWLCARLKISENESDISLFDMNMCERLIEIGKIQNKRWKL